MTSNVSAVPPSGGTAAQDRTSARLWLLLAALVAGHHVLVSWMTQNAVTALMTTMVWGGAIICLEDRLPTLQPAPSLLGLVFGSLLVAAGVWRGAQVIHLDAAFYGLPLVLGLGLALLCVPVRRLREFRDPLLALTLLAVALVLLRKLPEERLSITTAHVTQLLLSLVGFDAWVKGREVWMPGGAVSVAEPCNGIEMVTQLVVISGVFLLAFQLRSRWRQLAMIALAPVLAVLGNSVRILLLAIVNASDWSWKQPVFRFFHDEHGGLVFAGLTVALFGWIYLIVLEGDLRRVRRGVAGG